MKRFALIGAAGYVAPRHMRAIAELGHELAGAFDPNDSVGILDSYAPRAKYFNSLERFERWLQTHPPGRKIDYVVVCSPNHLHDAHVRLGLRLGCDVICEKPLVLNPHNLDAIDDVARETGRTVSTILQLRLHPNVQALKQAIKGDAQTGVADVELTYITPRGEWYDYSWKGDVKKSGGIATNIGIHFFDLLHYIFGSCAENIVHLSEPRRSAGFLRMERARVCWFLSIEWSDLALVSNEKASAPFRSIVVDGKQLDLSDSFIDLHTENYRQILAGNGCDTATVRPSVEMTSEIRTKSAEDNSRPMHPMVERVKKLRDS